MKKLDSWIFWSHKINGWKWAVFCGAKVLDEGFEATEPVARAKAKAAIAALTR